MKKKLISNEATLELPTYEKLQNMLTMPVRFARKLFFSKLGKLKKGLVIIEDGNEVFHLGSPENPGPRATLQVLDQDFYFAISSDYYGSLG